MSSWCRLRNHDCCKDKSASLLSALTTTAQKYLLISAPAGTLLTESNKLGTLDEEQLLQLPEVA